MNLNKLGYLLVVAEVLIVLALFALLAIAIA